MGSSQSSDKLHCNRYLDGQGPPSLALQANEGMGGMYKEQNGYQPQGQMTLEILHRGLPAFPKDNTLQVNYIFPDGIQTEKHPHPGQPYTGLHFCTYLPDNSKGCRVLKQLDKAFSQRLLFTVATNKDGKDTVTSTVTPLKTQLDGGSRQDTNPDSEYLKNVAKQLKDIGIV